MSKTDFRESYGSVIGAFVTEALAAIRKSERAGVKLFVQGSAVSKVIPKEGFSNEDLSKLRGQFLKGMISI